LDAAILSRNRYGVIAREAKILHARELGRLSIERRHATLVAFVIERQAALTDLAIETFGKLVPASAGPCYGRRGASPAWPRSLGGAQDRR